MSVDIIYQNVRSIRNKTTEFYNMLTHADADVISVTETWLNADCDNIEICPLNYQIFRHDRQYNLSHTLRGGGVLMAIRSDLLAFRLTDAECNLEFLEDIWLKIVLPDKVMYICTVYISPHANSNHYNSFFNKIKENISNFGSSSKILILGDFNLPHINWYNSNDILEPYLLNRSDTYEHFIDTLNLCNLSQVNKIRNTNNVLLDLVLSNIDYDDTLVSRTYDTLITNEDVHHPTLNISIKTKIAYLKCKNHKRLNFRKANYIGINNDLSQINWDFVNVMPLNESVDKFYSILYENIYKYTPQVNVKKKNPFWFTPEIKSLLRKKEYYRLKWKTTQDPIYYTEFSKLRQMAKQKITISFENHLNHIQTNIPNNVKVFWAYTKSKRKSNSYPHSFTHNGRSTTDPESICNMFSDFFKSTYSSDNSFEFNSSQNATSGNFLVDITLDNVSSVLSSIDPNKNGGPDGIPNIFLVNTAQTISYPLYLIFKKSLEIGVFPEKFKASFVTPIFKKGSKCEINNYRPVCILNAFSKIFERLVHNKIYDKVKDLLNPNQHGFMKGKSTSTNLMLYTNYIASHLDLSKTVHAIYTDFQKAFDSVNFNILLSKLQNTFGINGSLLRWFESYLKNRSQQVVFNGFKSSPFSAPSGVPQGSVLGPLLFNIFINDLCERLKCKFLLFADDLKIFSVINSHTDMLNIQSDLDALHDWCTINYIGLNATKCKLIEFSNRVNQTPHNYNINGVILEQVRSIVDLGVIFDSKLKFNEHIDLIVKKSYRTLGFIIRLTKRFRDWKCLNILYNSLVKSVLEYNSVIWSPYQSTYSHRIERVQKKFTRLLFFKRNIVYTDYENRLKQLNMLSLQNRRTYIDMCSLHNIIHNTVLQPLSEQLNYRNIPYPSRFNPLFVSSISRTNYGSNLNIIRRLQNTFISKFNDIDITNITLKDLQNIVTIKLNNI